MVQNVTTAVEENMKTNLKRTDASQAVLKGGINFSFFFFLKLH